MRVGLILENKDPEGAADRASNGVNLTSQTPADTKSGKKFQNSGGATGDRKKVSPVFLETGCASSTQLRRVGPRTGYSQVL